MTKYFIPLIGCGIESGVKKCSKPGLEEKKWKKSGWEKQM
jgi:hypothetical protein